MPQIDIQTFPSQIFWLLVCFCAVFCCVSYWFAPRLLRMIALRQRKTEEAYQKIEALRQETHTFKQECHDILTNARKEMARVLADVEKTTDQQQRDLQESLTQEIKTQLRKWEEDFKTDQRASQHDVIERIDAMVALCAQQMKDMAYDDRVSSFLDEIYQARSKVRH